jgi:hypothetical protein
MPRHPVSCHSPVLHPAWPSLWAAWLSHDQEPKREGRQEDMNRRTGEARLEYQSRRARWGDDLADILGPREYCSPNLYGF